MTKFEAMVRQLLEQARLDGYLDGLEAFAWWKDGVQYVGYVDGRPGDPLRPVSPLADAIALAKAGKLWNQQHYHLPDATTPSEETPG